MVGRPLGEMLSRDPEYWIKMAEEFRALSASVMPYQPLWAETLYKRALDFENWSVQAADAQRIRRKLAGIKPREWAQGASVAPNLTESIKTSSRARFVRPHERRPPKEPAGFVEVVGGIEYRSKLRKNGSNGRGRE